MTNHDSRPAPGTLTQAELHAEQRELSAAVWCAYRAGTDIQAPTLTRLAELDMELVRRRVPTTTKKE